MISRQAVATWQHPIGQLLVTWHPRQSRSTSVNDDRPPVNGDGPTVNGGGLRWRSMVAIGDQWWQSTTVAGGGPSLTTVDHHRTIGQRWLIGWVRSGHGPGLDRVGHVIFQLTILKDLTAKEIASIATSSSSRMIFINCLRYDVSLSSS
nr:hypothetical protein [Tanacetum cinerariifolium]